MMDKVFSVLHGVCNITFTNFICALVFDAAGHGITK